MEKEIRSISSEHAEVRLAEPIEGKEMEVSGYGIVFNSLSKDLGGFREIILPEAINGVLERSDVLALMNHDTSRGVLARSDKGQGSMTLTIDEIGVRYSFDAPKFSLGEELVEGIQRGDIKTSSFAFTVAKDGQKVERNKDGSYLRTITQFENIYDMSPVYSEAYSDTSVLVRSMEAIATDVIVTPVIEEPITKVVDEPEVREHKMDNYERYLYQQHKNYQIKNKR